MQLRVHTTLAVGILMSARRDFPAEGRHESVASGHAQLYDF